MKLSDILKTIAIQSGIPENDTVLTQLIGNSALALDVDEAVSTKLTANRLTMEAAKNDPTLKSHFHKEILDGIDARIDAGATKYGLSEDDIKELKSEKTTKRIEMLADKIALKEKLAANATGKNQGELNKEIEKLNGQMAEATAKHAKELDAEKQARVQDRVKWTTDSIYGGLDVKIASLDKDIAIDVYKAKVAQMMAKDGVVLKSTDDGRLELETTAGTKYFIQNKEVTPTEYIKRIGLENKFLETNKVNNQRTPGQVSTAIKSNVRGLEKFQEIVEQSVNAPLVDSAE